MPNLTEDFEDGDVEVTYPDRDDIDERDSGCPYCRMEVIPPSDPHPKCPECLAFLDFLLGR